MGALDEFFDAIDGVKVPGVKENELAKCDKCSDPIQPNTEVQLYCSDREMMQGKVDRFVVQRMYGEGCAVGRVKYPHKSTNELIVRATYTTEDTIETPEIVHFSGADDGYIWDPVEVWEAVTRVDYDTNFIITGGMKNGPEDIVDALSLFNVDIREVVDEQGNITIDEQKRAEIEKGISDAAVDLLGGNL